MRGFQLRKTYRELKKDMTENTEKIAIRIHKFEARRLAEFYRTNH